MGLHLPDGGWGSPGFFSNVSKLPLRTRLPQEEGRPLSANGASPSPHSYQRGSFSEM